MSTQILIFEPHALRSPIHCRLIEAAWPLSGVRIADLAMEYAEGPFDAGRERLRLTAVDTVILQIGDGAVCDLLEAWLIKALALEPGENDPGRVRTLVRRVGAVVVKSDLSRRDSADQSLTDVRALLGRLRRAVQSVGIDWLAPQVLDPDLHSQAVDIEILEFTRRLEEHPASERTSSPAIRGAETTRRLASRVTVWSAAAALACALTQIGLSRPGIDQTVSVTAWSDLATAWLGISLFAMAASAGVVSTPRNARLYAAIAALLFALQILSSLAPDAGANVLMAIPPMTLSLIMVAAIALTLFEVRRPITRLGAAGGRGAESGG